MASLLDQLPGAPTLAFLAAVVLIVGIVLWRAQRSLARHMDDAPAPEPRPETHETVRAMMVELESKTAALAQLIQEADRASERLEAAVAAARELADTAQEDAVRQRLAALSPTPHNGFGPPISQAEALRRSCPAEREQGDGGAAEQEEAAALPEEPAELPAAGRRAPIEERYESIYALADDGCDAAEIARRTGTPVGEVQLILSLRDRRR